MTDKASTHFLLSKAASCTRYVMQQRVIIALETSLCNQATSPVKAAIGFGPGHAAEINGWSFGLATT